jgi:CRP-like cAMP-binding protein
MKSGPRKKARRFNPESFLTQIGSGRTVVSLPQKHTVFAQGDASDAVFYIQEGRVRLTVVSSAGKEAIIAILNAGDFFGEGCLAGQPLRMASATTMTESSLMRIERKAMVGVLGREPKFSDMFVAYLLARNVRYEADLVDQF